LSANLTLPGLWKVPRDAVLSRGIFEKRHPEGEFPRVVKALLEAGSPLKGVKYPPGEAAVDEVLRAFI
jgi:hypothetical protein